MSSHDTPEKIQARRSMFARFAKLQAIQEEKKRQREQPIETNKTESYYDTWRPPAEKAAWEDRQLEYIKPYTAEYSTGEDQIRASIQSQTSGIESTNEDSSNANVDKNLQDGSVISEGSQDKGPGFLGRLSGLRGRGRRIGAKEGREAPDNVSQIATVTPVPAPPSICQDFERTSTIMLPTEVPAGDFNSNIDAKEIKKMYFNGYKSNEKLPIYQQRDKIINSINSYSVVIIEGATGCGKTTQVPMYILEDAIMVRPSARTPVIYVTQPRRIAARSIAERICNEHNWPMASLVGYQVSLEKQVGPQTVLVFCTAGVLLQKIIQEKSLKNYTHIIIDEAHERDADTDLLLMMIRKLMLTEMPLFRLIIMSATMDISKLKRYFTFKTSYGHQSVTTPSYVVAGQDRTPSIIQVVYLDKLRHSFGVDAEIPEFDLEQPELHEACLKAAVKLIVDVVPCLDNYHEKSKSTLVFLPGLAEISKLDRMIRAAPGATDCLDIIPLHSCLTVADQLKVFKPSRPGCRKVILATNIAESSITLTDVGFIVDFCLTKTMMKDSITRFPTLKLQWSTQDKATQRAGRTGRCCAGKVFRMVPFEFYKEFNAYAEPELLTAPLELSVLRVKNFQMGEIKALFAIVLDPPPFNEIRTAVLELKQIGALAATYKGELSEIDGDLTELGKVISSLPIDVHLSKLIVIASIFDVVEDAVIVAACLSTNRSVVRYLYGNQLDSYEIKLDWAKGSFSDLFASLDCYKEFKELKEDRGKADHWLATWCAKNNLDERKLHDVDAMVTEIQERLNYVNIFTNVDRPNQERDLNMDNLMLKVAFCAAFYPNYFLTEKLDPEKVRKELCGLDPTRTIVMHNIPVNQVPLYKTQITKQIKEEICPDLDFIADCSRALLILNGGDEMCSEGMQKVASALDEAKYQVIEKSREIPKAMYRALKMAESLELQVREYKDLPAHERMEFYLNQREEVRLRTGTRLLPSWFKIVEDRPPDNSRLIDSNDEDYANITEENYYVEVEFNHSQDIQDEHELFELEMYEAAHPNEINTTNKTFKPTYRRIRGPDSPIRMSFRSVLVKSRGFSVEIDGQSVNSILLDPEYIMDRRQMLVAAAVVQSKKGKVMVRDTTLMPNIRGLPTLMSLLFAQYYRLIYNERLNCIAGGIFGIGWNSQDEPLDRMYEVDLGFDVHITTDDIALINKARKMMSELLKFTEIQNSGRPQAQMQSDLRKIILTLLRRRRYPLAELDVAMIYYPNPEDDGVLFTKDVHNLSTDIIEDGETRPFLPLVNFTREYGEMELYRTIRENLSQLKRIEDDEESVPRGGIRCLVCGNGQKFCFVLCSNVLTHLCTDEHLKRVEEFNSFEERALRQQEQQLQ